MAYVKKGYKPGPGRPKGSKNPATLEKEHYRALLMEVARERFKPMVESQFDLATGFALIDKTDDTGLRIFDQKPDAAAGKNLMEQVIGKLKEEVDVTSDGKALPTPIIQIKRDV